jgi:ribonuclease Z
MHDTTGMIAAMMVVWHGMKVEKAGIDPARIKKVFITHLHGDHCFGLCGLLQSVSRSREGTPLAGAPFTVFGPPGLHRLIAGGLGFDGQPLSMPLVGGPMCCSCPSVQP